MGGVSNSDSDSGSGDSSAFRPRVDLRAPRRGGGAAFDLDGGTTCFVVLMFFFGAGFSLYNRLSDG